METTITKNEAQKLYPTAPAWLREKLEKDFGKETLTDDIINLVGSVEEAYAHVSEQRKAEFDREMSAKDLLCEDTVAFIKLKLVVDALNREVKPNFADQTKKWFTIYQFSAGSGFVFSHSNYHYDHSSSHVGARLCLLEERTANHFGSNPEFLKLMNTMSNPVKAAL